MYKRQPYTVYETVSLGRYPYLKGAFSSLSKEDVKIILDSIEKVGLTEYRDKMITELSGGQIQRVFLAKLFAQNPDIKMCIRDSLKMLRKSC